MELKSNIAATLDAGMGVLIVPLWNWNSTVFKDRLEKASFNRTFMELKLIRWRRNTTVNAVLIVPLWNWNRIELRILRRQHYGFNRTFMELKFARRTRGRRRNSGFNRTFMELKWLCGKHMSVGKVSFNRTFIELKFRPHWHILLFHKF